jgi:uncharacterized RDD family membrane protein YckC
MTTPNPYAPPEAPPPAPLATASATAVSSSAEYAGFVIRAVARIVDILVFSLLTGICVYLALNAGETPKGPNGAIVSQTRLDRVLSGAQLGGVIGNLAYHSIAEWIGGATLGKMLLGLRVRTAAKLGPCTLVRAIVRSLAYYIDGFFFAFVAYGAMSKSPTRQRLGDRWAGTVVVRASSLADAPSSTLVAMGVIAGAIAMLTSLGLALASR